jgi:hypothetical protein
VAETNAVFCSILFKKVRDKFILYNFCSTTVVSENYMLVLRLYPPNPARRFVATEDTILPTGGGVDGKHPLIVRKGQSFFGSIFSMHRSKDIYGPDGISSGRKYGRTNRFAQGKLNFSLPSIPSCCHRYFRRTYQ